jgi:hypothetical protein
VTARRQRADGRGLIGVQCRLVGRARACCRVCGQERDLPVASLADPDDGSLAGQQTLGREHGELRSGDDGEHARIGEISVGRLLKLPHRGAARERAGDLGQRVAAREGVVHLRQTRGARQPPIQRLQVGLRVDRGRTSGPRRELGGAEPLLGGAGSRHHSPVPELWVLGLGLAGRQRDPLHPLARQPSHLRPGQLGRTFFDLLAALGEVTQHRLGTPSISNSPRPADRQLTHPNRSRTSARNTARCSAPAADLCSYSAWASNAV